MGIMPYEPGLLSIPSDLRGPGGLGPAPKGDAGVRTSLRSEGLCPIAGPTPLQKGEPPDLRNDRGLQVALARSRSRSPRPSINNYFCPGTPLKTQAPKEKSEGAFFCSGSVRLCSDCRKCLSELCPGLLVLRNYFQPCGISSHKSTPRELCRAETNCAEAK